MPRIRLLLVDDHAILLEGLRALLRYYADIDVVGEAKNGVEAIEMVERLHPDIVLMDIAMPGMNGIEATKLIRERYPKSQVLVLSQYEAKEYVLPLIRSGAAGYILKSSMGADLIDALHSVARGDIYLSPTVAKVLAEEFRNPISDSEFVAEPLTLRESQILKFIADGKTNTQIALALSIRLNTIVWHRANLMSKLGVHSAAELVSYAWQHKLISKDN